MASITITTDKGFDLHSVKVALSKKAETWEDTIKDKEPIKNDDGFTGSLGKGYALRVEGEFNPKFTKGDTERISILKNGEAVVAFTDFGMPLKEFLFGIAINKFIGIGGEPVDLGALLAYTLMTKTTTSTQVSLFGGGGGDILFYNSDMTGTAASARFFGRAGNDVMEDHAGQSNKYDGETGKDTVTYNSITSSITVNLTDASQNQGEAAGDTYFSIENVIGTSQDDTLIGTKVKNVLNGGAGNDILIGGADSDKLIGGEGKDFASYQGSLVGVTVDLSDVTLNTGDAKGDTYTEIEGIMGSAQDDTLKGNAGANILYGGSGNDVIDSGGGNDELWGDSETFGVDGDDTFVFNGPGAVGDVKHIMDFDVFDRIQIDRAGFGLHPLWVLNVGTTLIIAHANPTATTNSPTFLVEQSTGDLFFDADGNGAGARQLIANVQFHSQQYLDLADFVIV